ncbi:hypothetical protein [Jeotgalibacillus sp. R-1-5s-1]|uniref:hypothetical protein n=1 Tax=Jeotgalibacillus sp. R-1-5s-1 TaxID=2555897 RepID=UPI00106A2293|nr:hypothetical protein [Jeotgalibacillus sp. R-1-5s-1]TFE01857.1 hypothetical protein E2491_03555 [Jeotgalibacillus sp. R-1-5s-1]
MMKGEIVDSQGAFVVNCINDVDRAVVSVDRIHYALGTVNRLLEDVNRVGRFVVSRLLSVPTVLTSVDATSRHFGNCELAVI